MGVDLEEECRRYERDMRAGRWRGPPPAKSISARTTSCPARASPDNGCGTSNSGSRRAPIRRAHPPGQRDHRTGGDYRPAAARPDCGDGPPRAAGRRMDEHSSGSWRSTTDLFNIPADTVDVVVTASDLDGRTLADLAREDWARSVFVRRITRSGTPIAVFPGTELQRGDVVTLVGPMRSVGEATGGSASRIARPTSATWCLSPSASSPARSSGCPR